MKKQGKVILGFILVFIVILLAVLNIADVPVSLGFTSFSAPLILVIIISVIIGALIAFLTTSTSLWQQKKEIKELKKQLSTYQNELEQKVAEALDKEKREMRNQQAELQASIHSEETNQENATSIGDKGQHSNKLDYFD
ncbi:MAG: lipopolysaccharide assembly LapA domain-containing protein [Enterococcus sp.]